MKIFLIFVLIAVASASTKCVSASSLNVRNKPVSGSVVKTLIKGSQVTIYETSDSWARIGTNQWVSRNYLTSCPSSSSSSSTPTSTKCVSASSLNVRNKPSGSIVKTLSKGSKVTIYEISNLWARIGSNQWVSRNYLTTCSSSSSSSSSTPTTTKCVSASSLNVRNKPVSGSVVKTLSKGTKVTIYEISNSWARIGSNLWVSRNYLTTCSSSSSSSSSSTSTSTSSSGKCFFPVKISGFDSFGNGICAARTSSRSHAGQDLRTKGNGEIFAAYDGVITRTTNCFTSCSTACSSGSDYRRMYGNGRCSGGKACVNSIFIYHAAIDRTLLYGEIDFIASGLGTGSRVSAGQKLGTARGCGMLHMEVYKGNVSSNTQISPAQCRSGTMPGALLKPDSFARNLKSNCVNL